MSAALDVGSAIRDVTYKRLELVLSVRRNYSREQIYLE